MKKRNIPVTFALSKWVEQFHGSTPSELEDRINNWCEMNELIPLSISVLKDGDEFVAFVVVEIVL